MTHPARILSPAGLAIGGVVVCALIWGTTWYAITLQLGVVDPTVSVVWRFGLSALVMFGFCLVTRRPVRMNRSQHLAALGQGAFVFAASYGFVYAAEERVASAVVAVMFAALAFLNLAMFRIVVGQKASRAAWGGALCGVMGVAVLSGGEIVAAGMDRTALTGVAFALIATLSSTVGNYFAWRGQQAQAPIATATAWAMAYGTGMLALYGLLTGVEWRIETDLSYLLALLYLALFGSVIAFGLYFSIARLKGYATASYISALTPPIAMLVSVLFEGARFGLSAFLGLALVLAGQLLLIRSPQA